MNATELNHLRTECRHVVTAWERRQQRHERGCHAAAAAFAELMGRGAGLAAPGASVAVAAALVGAYRDSTLGTEAPRPAAHDAAIEAAGDELRHCLDRLSSHGLSPAHLRVLAGIVIGRYHLHLAALEA